MDPTLSGKMSGTHYEPLYQVLAENTRVHYLFKVQLSAPLLLHHTSSVWQWNGQIKNWFVTRYLSGTPIRKLIMERRR